MLLSFVPVRRVDPMLSIATKKKLLLFLSLALGGCLHTPQPLNETTISIQIERPQEIHRESNFCYFIPPQGWDIADQTKLSPRVKICFIGKSSNYLLPSVNLATEEVNVSLKTYVDIVKKDCESDPNCLFRDLGPYKTSFGEGQLIEREVKTPWGIARQVQLIVIKDERAYILTAGALKDEFSSHYQDFEAVLKSLRLTTDLTADVVSPEKKELLSKLVGDLHRSVKAEGFDSTTFQKEAWHPFQEKIINDFTEMGPYWQILMLRDVQHQLFLNP